MSAVATPVGRPRYEDETEQYLRAICHDLRAPVRQLGEFMQLLESELGEEIGGDGQAFIGFMRTATHRLAERLTGLERLTAARTTPIAAEPIELATLVEAGYAALVSGRDGVVVEIDVIDGATSLEVDPALFTLAMAELLANSIDYSPERAEVRISAVEADGYTTISVADSGSGIRACDADVACDLFARFHPHDVSSTGAGLTVVRTVVERHGGTVTIDTDVDHGFDVRLTVPTIAGSRSPADETHRQRTPSDEAGIPQQLGPTRGTSELQGSLPGEPKAKPARTTDRRNGP